MILKIRSSDFRTTTRSIALPDATNVANAIWKAAADLFERSLASYILPVRLLGLGATKLTREPIVQGSKFDANADLRQSALDQTIDTIRAKFSGDAIERGSEVDKSMSSDEGMPLKKSRARPSK